MARPNLEWSFLYVFHHSLTESGLTIFPLFCSGAIPGQSPGHASWRFPLAA